MKLKELSEKLSAIAKDTEYIKTIAEKRPEDAKELLQDISRRLYELYNQMLN